MTVHFGRAAFELVDLVALVPTERFDDPGLGEWTLRELIGHTSRALSTVVGYLAQPEPGELTVQTASDYLEVVLRQRGDDDAIAELLRHGGPAEAAQALVSAALDSDSTDYITAGVAEVADGGTNTPRGAPEPVGFAGAAGTMFREEPE